MSLSIVHPDELPIRMKIRVVRKRQMRTVEDLSKLVKDFAVEHKDDDRKVFKREWAAFLENDVVKELIQKTYSPEQQPIMIDKMFFSARYYYRKRANKTEPTTMKRSESVSSDVQSVSSDVPTELDEPMANMPTPTNEHEQTPETSPTTKKRKYVKTDRKILKDIDDHLASLAKGPDGFQMEPGRAFAGFLTLYGEEMEQYKKTYKNRFYAEEKRIKKQ